MDRKTILEYFLRYYRDLAKNDPNFNMSSNYFYEELRRYGIPNYDDGLFYDSLFRYWQDRYRNIPNIKVYSAEQQPGFLQFANSHHKSNHLKMYLSLKPDKLQIATNLVFDYLAKNNIGHQSKAAIRDRSDVLVLRLENPNDVSRVLDFINNNKYLQEAFRPINPFIMNTGITGITFDGLLSYNMTASLLLEKYFNDRKNTGSLDAVSLEDFKTYISNFYNDTFVNKSKLNEFIQRNDIQKELLRLKQSRPYDNQIQEKTLINYMYVVDNINMSLHTNDYNYLLNNFVKYNNDINNQDLINSFSFSKYNSINNRNQYSEMLFKEYVWYAYNKYEQDIYKVQSAIFDYINGNNNAITRDNHFRQRFKAILSSKEIIRISAGNPYEYVNNLLMDLFAKTNLYEEACFNTYKKYGSGQLSYAIAKSLNSDFSAFTNGKEKVRDKLVERLNPDDVKYCIATILSINVDDEILNNPQVVVQNVVNKINLISQGSTVKNM